MNSFESAHPDGQNLFMSVVESLRTIHEDAEYRHAQGSTSLFLKGSKNLAYFYFKKTSPGIRSYFLSDTQDDFSLWAPLEITTTYRKGSFGELYPCFANINDREDAAIFTELLVEYCILQVANDKKNGKKRLRQSNDDDTIFIEGLRTPTIANRIERSVSARNACIAHHGVVCTVCGFSFQETYGEIGKGFIEIHHLNMIGYSSHRHFVDPVKDLVPLCSNCHSVAHRKNPPFTVNEMKDLIGRDR